MVLYIFPGTINLKPFEMLKLSDFNKDHEINVLGLVNVLKFYKKIKTIIHPWYFLAQ